MRYYYRFPRLEVPNVDVVDVQNPLELLELPTQLVQIDVSRRRLHHQIVTILNDGHSRNQGENGEYVSSNRIEEMVHVPLCNIASMIRAEKINNEC